MGNWFSTRNSESKQIEADGGVNNNVIIQGESVDYGFQIMVLVAIVCALKVFELVIYFYKKHTKYVKQSYSRELKSGNNNV